MMRLMALVAAAATASTPIETITNAAYRDYLAQLTDKFAPATVRPANGQAFRMVVPFGNGDDRRVRVGSPYYSYADGVLTLALSSEETDGDRLSMIVGRPRTITASSYRGSNAFGATANVRSERVLWQGVALVTGPAGETMSRFRGLNYVGPHDYWFREALDGPAAKAVAVDSDLIVEGELTPLPNGKPASCATRISDPTIGHPLEVFATRCFAGAKVKRVAFVRRSSGKVLKEWR